ncbi:hypothetical protein [Streptomyces sp. NPDC088762]|uniref:hypothetical protein n=1 Tax=Streptomyces sp. NPDC088762 TaxID=3365891 RepID=UPI0038135CD0
MTDAQIRIPREAKDRLAAMAATEGLSLRAYLARLAESLPTPAERAGTVPQAGSGYAPTAAEQQDLDRELDRRLAEARDQ